MIIASSDRWMSREWCKIHNKERKPQTVMAKSNELRIPSVWTVKWGGHDWKEQYFVRSLICASMWMAVMFNILLNTCPKLFCAVCTWRTVQSPATVDVATAACLAAYCMQQHHNTQKQMHFCVHHKLFLNKLKREEKNETRIMNIECASTTLHSFLRIRTMDWLIDPLTYWRLCLIALPLCCLYWAMCVFFLVLSFSFSVSISTCSSISTCCSVHTIALRV